MINYQKLEEQIPQLSKQYAAAEPFPWVIFENFLEEGYAEKIAADFAGALSSKDPLAPKKHKHVNRKIGTMTLSLMSEIQRNFFEEVASEKFINYLKRITGIKNIYPDPDLAGGGLHEIHSEGYLNVHTDFNFHPKTSLHRKLNMILYLNENWKSEYKGSLEFWNADVTAPIAAVAPLINRCVLFETSEISYHGHPDPLELPDGVTRKSMAVYYYSDWPENLERRNKTNYKLTPNQEKSLRQKMTSHLERGLVKKDDLIAALPEFPVSEVIRVWEDMEPPFVERVRELRVGRRVKDFLKKMINKTGVDQS